ncbi:hypothetical protein NL108_018171 [Boleophthalmus pectinirostris]|nr:hypothetical protein NL108_018171 [Boleophthalmus pectinirostris]
MSLKEETNAILVENNELEATMETADVNKEIVNLSTTTPSVKIKSSNVEISTTTAAADDSETVDEMDSSVVFIQSSEPKTVEAPARGDSDMDTSSVLVEDLILTSEHETKSEKSQQTLSPNDVEVLSEVQPETKMEDDSKMSVDLNHTVRLFSEGFSHSPGFDVSFGLVPLAVEGSGAVPGDGEAAGSIPGVSGSLQSRPDRALTVFFSLRVTNMIFNQNLFNKSSDEYRRLENKFVSLLVPFLESHLQNFQELQILNFRNGSVVVNSRLRFVTPVRRGVTTAVYLLLRDFAASAQTSTDLSIDRSSLHVTSGERADACKYLACNSFSRCRVDPVSSEAACVCNRGYESVDGLPCVSVCDLRPDFCLNDGKCDVVPGQGAICRCRVGERWFFRGRHCEEFVSETLVVFGAVGSVLCFLFVTVVIVYVLSKFLRQHESEEGISLDGQKWDRSRFQVPFESESPVLAQSYRRYDDHVTPPPYTQAPPPLPGHSDAISRQEATQRLKVLHRLCSTDPTRDLTQTTLFVERRGSSFT